MTVPSLRCAVDAVRAATLDAELAAIAWLLVEGHVPLLVSSPVDGDDRDAAALADALLAFAAPGDVVRRLAGDDETFDWLPQAGEMGWGRPRTTAVMPDGDAASPGPGVRPDTTVIVAHDLAGTRPPASHAGGEVARLAVRAATIGYGLVATVRGERLEDVLDAVRRAPLHLTEDEASRLGVVLITGRDGGDRLRVHAAHYVRPIARDEHGHVQRLGPAVLATWDPTTSRFEHFGWGIMPELARRIGRRAGDLERDIAERASVLAELAAGDPDDATIEHAIARAFERAPSIATPATARGSE